MWNTLPDLTGSCARGAKPIGVFGLEAVPLPGPTKAPFWLGLHSIVVLPIITILAINIISVHNWQDTHDHDDIILPTDSGPLGLGRIPEASAEAEVAMRDPYVIAVNRRPQHIDAVFRFTIRWLVTVNILLGTFTLFNLYIYPRYIYEAPVPILHSPPVNTLHPHQI